MKELSANSILIRADAICRESKLEKEQEQTGIRSDQVKAAIQAIVEAINESNSTEDQYE